MPDDVAAALAAGESALSSLNVPHALIGGLAVSRHGLPRPTRDVDFLVSVEKIRMPALLQAMTKAGFQVDEMKAVRQLSQDGLTRLPFKSSAADLMLAILPQFKEMVKRAEPVDFEGRVLPVARAEDILILKTVALRETDRRDIEGIVAAQGERLDLARIRLGVSQLTLPGDGKSEFLESVLARHGLGR